MYVEPVRGYYLSTEIYSDIFLFFQWHFIFITKKKKNADCDFHTYAVIKEYDNRVLQSYCRGFFFFEG